MKGDNITMKEKARAYDEALERAKKELGTCGSHDCDAARQIFRLFPELKESEDERIRKWIIDDIRYNMNNEPLNNSEYKKEAEKAIAWLEKQWEQYDNEDLNILQRFSFYSYKDEPNILYLSGLYVNEKCRNKGIGTKILEVADKVAKSLNCHTIRLKTKKGTNAERLYRTHGYNSLATEEKDEIWLEKQGEQTFIIDEILTATNYDKMFQSCRVHKFNVGDWITDGYLHCKISDILDDRYIVDTTEFAKRSAIPFKREDYYHLWKIADAKNGNVLYSLDSKQPFIFKHRNPNEQAEVYCGINTYDKFFVENTKDCIITTDKYIPATNEQRELLFQKMHDAGYEWDDEKKVLKKIEQKPTDKVEPKFKVGDWVVCEITGLIYQIEHCIEHLNNPKYGYILIDGRYIGSDDAEFYHLWTIQDAKDGDVLCYKDEVFLYKHDIKNCTKKETTFGGIVYYCCYDGKRFITDSLYSLSEQNKIDIHPAVKEQRDLLFTKMRETGLKWDAEKKELKMIEEEYNEKSSSKCQL